MIYYIQLVIYVIAIIQGFRGAHGGFTDDQIDLNRTPPMERIPTKRME
jgi:hypothetical protein